MELNDHLRRLAESDPALAAELAPLRGLEGIFRWMESRGLPLGELELIAQDEFSHDVLVPLGASTIVFGIT
jgi:hypothetical protein